MQIEYVETLVVVA
jgi:hypothetical protein